MTSADKIIPLPESFSFEQGALVEPVSVAVHAASRGRATSPAGACRAGRGADRQPGGAGGPQRGRAGAGHRSERLPPGCRRQCGLDRTFPTPGRKPWRRPPSAVFGEDGFDVAFECVGVEPTITAAVEAIEKGGTLIVVGVFGEKPRVDMGLVQDRELNIHGTLMYKRQDYEPRSS